MADGFTREKSVWTFLQDCEVPIFIYGMGNGGDKVLRQFDRLGIVCSGVVASDDFVRGQSFHGYKVERVSDVEKRLEDFVIAVTFASQLPNVMNHIYELANSHTVVAPTVPVFGDTLCDDEFLHRNKDKIATAYSLLSDQQSKKVYRGALQFYYTGRLSYLPIITTEKAEAYSNILSLRMDEGYMDLGAYRGDTIGEFLSYTNNSYNNITALEPDPKTFKKLSKYCEELSRTQLYQMGVYKENTTLLFDNQSGRSSTLKNNKGITTRVTTIDDLSINKKVSYIKMDIEGVEGDAVAGGVNTLKTQVPKLNVAAYHTFEDLFELILQINSINSDYEFYLRHHPYIPCWDTNLYCKNRYSQA